MMRTHENRIRMQAGIIAAAMLLVGHTAGADGTETLGAASLGLESGTGIVAAGIGLNAGGAAPFSNVDGTIDVTVPAGATVSQVILYWAGQMLDDDAGMNDDATIVVNGNSVTGALIGGPTFFFSSGGRVNVDGYRSDITSLGLVGEGANSLDISGLGYFAGPNLAGGNMGAGVIVVIDEGGPFADLQLNDGIDLAFCGFSEPRKSTVPQPYAFASSAEARQGELSIFVGSVGMEVPPPDTTVVVTPDVGLQQTFSNLLASIDGDFWDTAVLQVDIPAGASEVVVEVVSGAPGDCTADAASSTWIAAALEVGQAPFCGDGIPDPPDEECDDGNDDDNDACRNDCTLPFCGDGTLDPGEECDDGNNAPGDGCSEICTLEDECALDVQKLCFVVPSSSGLLCESKIAATTLRYTGPDAPNSTIVFTGKEDGDATYTSVNLVAGAVLTAADQGGFTVDSRPATLGAQTTITLNGVDEVIHTSCSAIYEAGLPAPLDNPKGDPSPNWEVVNFVDKDGKMVSEVAPDPDPTSECTIAAVSKDSSKKKTSPSSSSSNQVEYSYVITNTGSVDVLDVFAFDDVLDREVTGSPIAMLAPNESTTLTEIVEVNATVTNTVFVSGATAAGAMCEDEASATVTVEMPENLCETGKPVELIFEYTGEGCSDTGNTQEKDRCDGDPMGAGDVSIVITKDADKLAADPSSGINIGDQVTFSKNDGNRLPAELKFDVKDGSTRLQSLNIHASCSDDLILGERFGSMVLVGFTPPSKTVPEPGVLVSLGPGLTLLAWLGRRRRRRTIDR